MAKMFVADIEKKIDSDYGELASKARAILENGFSPSTTAPRVVRCVIALAEKSLDKLQEMVIRAKEDSRDVMYWAEYEKSGKQIADYNKPFSAWVRLRVY